MQPCRRRCKFWTAWPLWSPFFLGRIPLGLRLQKKPLPPPLGPRLVTDLGGGPSLRTATSARNTREFWRLGTLLPFNYSLSVVSLTFAGGDCCFPKLTKCASVGESAASYSALSSSQSCLAASPAPMCRLPLPPSVPGTIPNPYPTGKNPRTVRPAYRRTFRFPAGRRKLPGTPTPEASQPGTGRQAAL